jgi:putative heme transporter
MQTDVHSNTEPNTHTTPLAGWTKWLVISLTLLVWVVLLGVVFWLIGHVGQALLLLAIGAVLAYTIYPLVKQVQRFLPRPLAIALVYLLVLVLLSILVYFIVVTVIDQMTSLIGYIQAVLNGDRTHQWQPILATLEQFGVSQEQLRTFGEQILGQLQGVV